MSASMPTWTAAVPSDRSMSLRHMIHQQPQHISIADCASVELGDHVVRTRNRSALPRAKLTPSEFGGTMALASTSLGEASARIQATDLERRKTPRVRTAPPGLRVEPKWLPESPDTPCSAKALSRGVRRPAHLPVPPRPVCTVQAPLCALAARR
jgi:hypothetical protein